jgi:hypothetical protein
MKRIGIKNEDIEIASLCAAKIFDYFFTITPKGKIVLP